MESLTTITHPGPIPMETFPVLLRQDHTRTVTLSQQADGTPVAITEISPTLARSPAFAEQFEPVMEVATRLSHPAILPILDFGIRGGVPYIVSPYITRGMLSGEIHMSGRLSLERTIDIIGQLADAIDYIHSQDLIHCGLTAEVVLRGPDGSIILDHTGLADLLYQASAMMPQTLPYAAPELLLKAPYTVRVDIYALGILGFQMLSGRLPFSGITTTQYMQAHLRLPLPPLTPELPEAVHMVLKRASGKLAHSRYWTAREMAHELAAAAGIQSPFHLPRPSRSISQMLLRYRSLRPAAARQKGNLKVSEMYTEALLREKQNPVEARQIYHQILDLWPRMAQGDVLDHLMGLERQMLADQAGTIRAQAQRALNRGDWALLLRAGQELLDVNSTDVEAEQMHHLASTMLAAEEHYRTACLADMLSDIPASMQLTQELFTALPNFSDSQGITVIAPRRAPYVRETASSRAHESNILTLEFSTDGRLLASGSTDKNVRISWPPRLETSVLLDSFHSWVCTLGFSPDGEYLLTGLWDGEIRLWRLPDGQYHGMIAGLVNQIQGVSFAHHEPDLMAVAAGSFLTVWRIPSGDRVATVKENDLHSISALAYSPASPWLICGMTHGGLRVRDASVPEYPIIAEIPAHKSAVHGVTCLADGIRVASISHYDSARVSNLLSGEVLYELRGHEDAVLCLASSASEPLIVTGGADGTVRLWDAEHGQPVAVLTGHNRPVSRVAISPDSRRIASADSGGTIRLWNI